MEAKKPGYRGPFALNGYQIKLLALAIMTIDHLAAFGAFEMSAQLYSDMRLIGRIAAPLFLFMNAEALRHTRSRAKFLARLYLAGVLVGAANACMALRFPGTLAADLGNMFPTFFYVGLYVCCVDALRARRAKGIAAALCGLILPFGFSALHVYLGQTGQPHLRMWMNVFLPSPLAVDYSLLFVLLGVAWYLIDNVRVNCLVFLALSLISRAVPVSIFYSDAFLRVPLLNPANFTVWHLFTNTQWWMLLAIGPMLMYNGERGRGMKYLFYLYYPLHQYAIVLFGLFFH